MSQTNQRKTPASAHDRPARAHPRPNPHHQYRRPEPTYRARSVTTGITKPTRTLPAQVAGNRISTGRRRTKRILLGLLLILMVGASGAGYVIFNTTIQPLINLPGEISKPPVGVRVVDGDGTASPDSTPQVVVVEPPDWASDEPVNILLLGLDYRPTEEDTRADTQIIVHIDPAAKTATMFSIPRDLYVNIPSFGMGRINQSYQMGDRAERLDPGSLPGGGSTLAMSTISATFGIPIHYYAQVNFQGFEQVVDALGGLDIDVPRPLVDNDYPLSVSTSNGTTESYVSSYGTTRIYIPAGLQHMNGKTALQYARSRHSDSDLGRNQRQQQVLLALKQSGMSFNIIPKLGELASKLAGAVHTDIPLDQMPSLAKLAQEIGSGSVTTCGIDASMVEQTILDSGADVLMPIWERIRPRIKQCFSDPQLVNENARLSVQNGTTVGGTGSIVSELLADKGLNVVDLSSAIDQGEHPRTTITDYTGGQKPHTIALIQKELGLPGTAVLKGDPAEAPLANNTDGKPVDILVMVGDDRLNKQPSRTPTLNR